MGQATLRKKTHKWPKYEIGVNRWGKKWGQWSNESIGQTWHQSDIDKDNQSDNKSK